MKSCRISSLVLGISVVLFFAELISAEIVTFPDTNLESAVRNELGIPSPTPITDSDMLIMTSLWAQSADITYLNGLEYAENLSYMYMGDNNITDLSPLQNLTSLTYLYLHDNSIGDLTPLTNLTNLIYLWIYNNNISDLAPLTNLTNLTSLYLSYNSISDLSPLANLINLPYLYLSYNNISDLSPLENLTSLTYLDLRSTPLDIIAYCIYIPQIQANNPGIYLRYDSSPYLGCNDPVPFNDMNLKTAVETELGLADPTPTNMLTLTYLSAPSSAISSLTGLEYALNIEILDLQSNQITDISPLADMTSLTWLDLRGNLLDYDAYSIYLPSIETHNPGIDLYYDAYVNVYFTDLNLKTAVETQLGITDPNASDMLDLTDLYAVGRNISDLSGLEYALNLTQLNLWFNNIADISILSSLTNLTDLNVSDNQISDISALSGLINLANLGLSNNQITDISALSSLTNLTELYLNHNQLNDISALSSMTNLTWLVLSGNQISDITALSSMTNLSWLLLSDNQISDITILSSLMNLNTLGLSYNPLNTSAYCTSLAIIQSNNPDICLEYDLSPNPITSDCHSDLVDLEELAAVWLSDTCDESDNWCSGSDVDQDHDVDLEDFSETAVIWLGTGLLPDPPCTGP
ncbi:MAG: leucine-rich repeat domain-containing protein [Sedimentisphaerales bacterium]|nr:leucine-rich repeat domain-containing protein [Sedimentisphaerales bacterium]